LSNRPPERGSIVCVYFALPESAACAVVGFRDSRGTAEIKNL
jgi:hypothetical protein